MTPNVTDYVAAGYFLSRYGAAQDCTGLQLRRMSMGHDHSQRRFFPETWTLSWSAARLMEPESEEDGEKAGWRPWLLVRYPL